METTPTSFDPSPWIEHLKHPLVLFGFALLVLAGLLRLFNAEKLSAKGTEQLMSKGLLYTFVVAILIIALGFVSSFMQSQANKPQTSISQESKGKNSPNSVGANVAVEKVDQKSQGDQSPNTVGAADVSVQK